MNIHHIDISQMDQRISKLEIFSSIGCKKSPLWSSELPDLWYHKKVLLKKMMVILEKALAHFAELINETLHKDVKDIPGAGAAGGLGAALMAF